MILALIGSDSSSAKSSAVQLTRLVLDSVDKETRVAISAPPPLRLHFNGSMGCISSDLSSLGILYLLFIAGKYLAI